MKAFIFLVAKPEINNATQTELTFHYPRLICSCGDGNTFLYMAIHNVQHIRVVINRCFTQSLV
jgi:hypothetical protein